MAPHCIGESFVTFILANNDAYAASHAAMFYHC